MTRPLENLAERVQSDPFFLGCPLYWYAHSEGLTDAGLADELGCTQETLVKVRLCGTPESKPAALARDVAAIARRFGLDEAALGRAVRRGTFLLKAQSASTAAVAARDRKREEQS